MKKLIPLLIFVTFAAQAQRDLLKSNLSEYGKTMTYEEVWTDDEFIVLLAKGSINKKISHLFLVINPDQGIVASHIIERETLNPYTNMMFSDAETFTVFYRAMEKMKKKNYALTFSKTTREIRVQEIGEELEQIEKEAIFTFSHNDVHFFASVSKDKQKIGFRLLSDQGIASTTHVFDVSDTLWRFINPNKSNSSRKVLSAYVTGNSIKTVGYEEKGKKFIAYIFNFDLETQKVTTRSFTQPVNAFRDFSMSFADDNIFLLKMAASASNQPPAYQMDLEILEYPTFESLQVYSTSLASLPIPYKTSRVSQLSFKSGLYFSGRNRKFTEPVQENVSTINLLSRLSRGEPFLFAKSGADNNIHLTIGSREDQLITNTVITTVTYFFGCIDSTLKPCVGSQKSPSEKIIEYLTTIREEKPDYLEFGNKRTFGVFNLYDKDEIVLMEF